MSGGLFIRERLSLHSGAFAEWKIEADALSDAEIDVLAWLISERVRPFSTVEGVPRGGLRLATSLSKYSWPTGRLLIVDDVCTTGNSLEAHRAGRTALGYVIFARGPVPSWTRALFTLDA